MNARAGVVVLAVALVVAFVVARHTPSGAARATEPAAQAVASEPPMPATRPTSVAVPASDAAVRPPVSVVAGPAAAPPPIAADAAAALALTLRDGDPRSPPIAPREPVADDPPPTTNELADPAAYRRYEARRQARVYRAFEREASIALVDLQRDIDRARAAGVPAEQIAEGEEKARMLTETLRKVQDGSIGAND